MNEQQARNKGYSFTGHYQRTREILMNSLNQLHDAGYKAVIVTEPDSKYSRGIIIGTGYSIYAEQKYFADQRRAELTTKLGSFSKRREHTLSEYNQHLKEINDEEKRTTDELKELEQ